MKNTIYKIAYFTGTGGTRKAAMTLQQNLCEKGCSVILEQIKADCAPINDFDYFILLFPVYAFSSPQIVTKWVKQTNGNGRNAAVISVSGGGDVTGNRAARVSCINRLKKQGYVVSYENELVMPSNFASETPKKLVIELFAALPNKMNGIADDIVAQKTVLTKAPVLDQAIAFICKPEKYAVKPFGKLIRVSDACVGCAKCESNCSTKNITMENGRPVFHTNCNLCTACVYGCPTKALKPKLFQFIFIKNGFDILAMAKESENETRLTEAEIAKQCNTLGWQGIGKYLSKEPK
jgi:ferredoxin/flavodoxin